jgi:rod shape-determining protein MreD
MTWVIMMFVVTGSAMAQALIPVSEFLGYAKVPLLLVTVLYYALNRGVGVMLASAFLAGFLQDALSPLPLGYSVFCFCLVGWIASLFRNMVLIESILTAVLFGGSAALSVVLLQYILLAKAGLIVEGMGWLMLRMTGTAMLAALSAPPMFWLVRKLDHWVGNIEWSHSDGLE